MIATLGVQLNDEGKVDNNNFLYINDTALTGTETRQDKINAMRNLLVWTMLSKAYIVQFLKNNQEWAGPANELKKVAELPTPIGPRRFEDNGIFAHARM